jgi:hypothetical protein
MRYRNNAILLVVVLQTGQILKHPCGQSHAPVSGISRHPNIQPLQASEQAVLRIWFRDPVFFYL